MSSALRLNAQRPAVGQSAQAPGGVVQIPRASIQPAQGNHTNQERLQALLTAVRERRISTPSVASNRSQASAPLLPRNRAVQSYNGPNQNSNGGRVNEGRTIKQECVDCLGQCCVRITAAVCVIGCASAGLALGCCK